MYLYYVTFNPKESQDNKLSIIGRSSKEKPPTEELVLLPANDSGSRKSRSGRTNEQRIGSKSITIRSQAPNGDSKKGSE